MDKEYRTKEMDRFFDVDERKWDEAAYKRGLRVILEHRGLKDYQILADQKIKRFPVKKVRDFLRSMINKEYDIIPFRTFGLVEEQKDMKLMTFADYRIDTYTICNKHAYMSTFIYEMSDSQISKDPFLQMSLERFYSRKSGYGSKLLTHITKASKKYSVPLTVWCENESLKKYYLRHGFDFQYKSLVTGHYFLTYNLQ